MTSNHNFGSAPKKACPAEETARAVREFVDTEVIPHERRLAVGDAESAALLAKLTDRARDLGLWGVYYPVEFGGRGFTLTEYLRIAEQEGRSEFGPAVLGADTVLDAHMLHRHGTPQLRERFLARMAEGTELPSYGMTEPGRSGSNPATLATSARLDGDTWVLDGRKWFISNIERATFITVMARTEGLMADPRASFSMIVVPTTAPGYEVVRRLPVLGRFTGQCEISLTGVRVPAAHLLGERGAGMAIAGERLGLGRTLRAMHWLGQAQRAFDLMCRRLRTTRVFTETLADRQLLQQHVFDSYTAIMGARSLLALAAARLDRGEAAPVEVSAAKVAASRALSLVVDRAVQAHGAEGLSDDTPLSMMYRSARATRILDGPDETHIGSAGKRLLRSFASHDSYDFAAADPVGTR